MDVKDFLHRGLSIGEEEVDALAGQAARAERRSRSVGDAHKIGGAGGIEVRQIGGVPNGYDKEMAGVHWLNVHERCAPVVAIHEACWKLSIEDAAKYAVAHRCSGQGSRGVRRPSSTV
jgi:hypothetical protein